MENRIQTVCLMVLTSIGVAFALFWLRPVMIPFVLALFASIGLSAMTDFQVERLRVPRPLALPATLVLGGQGNRLYLGCVSFGPAKPGETSRAIIVHQ